MSRPGSSPDEKGVSQNGNPGGRLCVFTNSHSAAVSPETRLLSAFEKDTHTRKVYLAGRGESAHLRSARTTTKPRHKSRGTGSPAPIYIKFQSILLNCIPASLTCVLLLVLVPPTEDSCRDATKTMRGERTRVNLFSETRDVPRSVT